MGKIMKRSQFYTNKNIYKGRSGLTADNEIDVCYRKHVIGSECDAITVRNDI